MNKLKNVKQILDANYFVLGVLFIGINKQNNYYILNINYCK